MKKTILFFGLIAAFAACNTQTSESEPTTTDSTVVVVDSTTAPVDTTKVTEPVVDTAKVETGVK